MATQMLEQSLGKKKPKPSAEAARDRIDLRADPAWVARIERQAERYGLTVSAYIRRAVSKELELDEQSDPTKDRRT